jgi:CCR4-NOT transcription complex subunit 6
MYTKNNNSNNGGNAVNGFLNNINSTGSPRSNNIGVNGYSEQDWNDEYNNTGNEQGTYMASTNNLNLANAVSLLSISHGSPALSDHHTQSRQASSPHYHARMAAAVARSQLSSPSRKTTTAVTAAATGGGAATTTTTTLVEVKKTGYSEDDRSNTSTGDSNKGEQLWTILDMGGLGLKHLSTQLFRYEFLTTIYLNHNQLAYLPPDIAKLRHLSKLDCSGNNISALPTTIGQLVSLKQLLVYDNQLVTLPNEVGMLYQLETLGWEGNPLQNDLQALLLSEGTHGLINSLREHVPGKG